MKNKLLAILTASLASLKTEGKFARSLLWKHSRVEVYHEIYDGVHSFVLKFVRIAFVGFFLSFFQETAVLDWIKHHWISMLAAFVVYTLVTRLTSVMTQSYRELGRNAIDLELWKLVWGKNNSVGIGTRVSSQFRQKLRTARRCSTYDMKTVGMWPIEAVSALLSSMALLGTLAFLNWRIGIIFIITASVTAIVGAGMARWGREREKELQEDEDRAQEYYPASLSIDSTYLNTSYLLFKRASDMRRQLMRNKALFHRKAVLVTTMVGSFAVIALAAQLYVTRESLFEGASLVKLGITVSTVMMAIGSFTEVVRSLFGEQGAIEDVREFLEFLDLPDEEKDKNDASFDMAEGDTLRIVEAEFRYPYVEHAPLVIHSVSLEFVPGEAVAIVGSNGSGKTTLGALLSNIHRPQKGCVMYGGTLIGGRTARSVLEHAIVIPQSGDLYDLPLSESLFGVTDMSAIDMERYRKAIAMSGAKEVLERLPNGIHTQIGTAYRGGVNMSGGESQRLRLAGFFYRALDPRIRVIIADEPSRYLDGETRGRVYLELISLARDRNKIVLVISHDAELDQFDRVVVLEKGMVRADHRGEELAKAIPVISKRLAGDLVHKSD